VGEIKINASIRPSKTNRYKHDLRKKGLAPAVVYGKGIDNVAIEVDVKDLESVIRKKGRNALIDLALRDKQGNNKYVVMVKEIQRDPIHREIKHVDLYKISMGDKIHTTVPVILAGDAQGRIAGGVVQAGLRDIDLECLPGKIPDNVKVDISSLEIGDHLTVADLPRNQDYQIISDPEAALVTILSTRVTDLTETEAPALAKPQVEEANPEG